MPNYAVDYSYKVEEFNVINVEADDIKHAEIVALNQLQEDFPELKDVQIEGVLELH